MNKISTVLLTACSLLVAISCKKSKSSGTEEGGEGEVKVITETVNGSTYKLFIADATSYKGILVMGSGNNESNPTPGSLNGAAETDICKKAAANGYAAAIVQYRKTRGLADWNASAQMIGQDYEKCISAIAGKYGIDKNKSVVGGYSYASFMLLTDNAYYNSIPYCKGMLAACGAISDGQPNFHIPIYSINCAGNNEGNYSGKDLYDRMPAGAIKTKSEGVTDNSCNTHCGGNWTDKMYAKMVSWLQ